MAKFITDWHRFNTVFSGPGQVSPDNLSNLVGSNTGTAKLEYTDVLELHDPTVENSDGDILNLSSRLPDDPNVIITGIQYQVFIKHSTGGANSIIYHYPKIGSTTITDANNGASFVSGLEVGTGGTLVKFKSSIVDEDLGLGDDLSPSNVDDIKLRMDYAFQVGPNVSFTIEGKDFEDSDGPSPAVRLEYELPPRLNITSGRTNITNGRVNIV